MVKRGTNAADMIRLGGFRNYVRAVRHAARYGLACDRAGHPVTIDEYCEIVGLTRSMFFKEQRAWRACFAEKVSVPDVLTEAALKTKGWDEEQREDAIARFLYEG